MSDQKHAFIIVTTPMVAGYKIKKVLGLVTGLTPRTRGVLGQFKGGIESMFGGEVTSFTSEIEKARWEA
ncbi:MAG: YbjQ family protein, partial [Nitrososphaerota archaeon]|nr:YbjQ family protein [Nitrososphaerota archaeon]